MKTVTLNIYSFLILLNGLLFSLPCAAYSVLTHEAIIDASWEKSIQPLLKLKYPGTTEEQLQEAHAYAYGGAIIQDMGYYPFGSKLFSDLVHYVRSGDFVNALLEESADVNEYAFALGALSHYVSDNYGHSIGTNLAVPITYPKDKEKYGNLVTYAQDRTSHLRMEFSFDVLQTVRGNYASLAYHNFIGFKVSTQVLERAFVKTYGIDIKDIFKDFSVAVDTFGWSVKNLIPEATKYAWIIKESEINKTDLSSAAKKFKYKMIRANYYQEDGKKHKKPQVLTWTFSRILQIFPKIGPLKGLRFKHPGKEAEKLFIQSFDTVMAYNTSYLKKLANGKIILKNTDLDTGNATESGTYNLADDSYSKLLLKLKKKKFKNLNASVKNDILEYYSYPNLTIAKEKKSRIRKKMTAALEDLKNAPIAVELYSVSKI